MDDFEPDWISRQTFTLLAVISPVMAFLPIPPLFKLLSFVGIFVGIVGAFRRRESLRWISAAIGAIALWLVFYFIMFVNGADESPQSAPAQINSSQI